MAPVLDSRASRGDGRVSTTNNFHDDAAVRETTSSGRSTRLPNKLYCSSTALAAVGMEVGSVVGRPDALQL